MTFECRDFLFVEPAEVERSPVHRPDARSITVFSPPTLALLDAQQEYSSSESSDDEGRGGTLEDELADLDRTIALNHAFYHSDDGSWHSGSWHPGSGSSSSSGSGGSSSGSSDGGSEMDAEAAAEDLQAWAAAAAAEAAIGADMETKPPPQPMSEAMLQFARFAIESCPRVPRHGACGAAGRAAAAGGSTPPGAPDHPGGPGGRWPAARRRCARPGAPLRAHGRWQSRGQPDEEGLSQPHGPSVLLAAAAARRMAAAREQWCDAGRASAALQEQTRVLGARLGLVAYQLRVPLDPHEDFGVHTL